jgi:hypothetical protein
MSHFNGVDSKHVVSIEDVELDENYAIVISTNGGLWRYIMGDTIRFTSKTPYRFKITGRTKSFINSFGEEVIVENTERAVAEACQRTGAQIKEYSVCPVFMDGGNRGAHEWVIEFVKSPEEIERFNSILDESLRGLNSDYDAKRYHNMVLEKPVINQVPAGTFDAWLKSINKLGGQNKVPRLANDRVILEQILQIAEGQH